MGDQSGARKTSLPGSDDPYFIPTPVVAASAAFNALVAGKPFEKVVFHDHRVGFSLLCNGVEVFDDTGEILPDATTVAPHRPWPPHRTAT